MPSTRTALACVAVAITASCTGDIFSRGPAVTAPPSEPPGPEVIAPVVVTPAAPQVRMLSAAEYRNTVRDLLGLAVSSHLAQADWTAGFDNGANIIVDENLLAALADEADALSAAYLAGRGRSDFPCFDPANVSDACMMSLIAGLGRRAHRRPLSAEQQAELFSFFSRSAGQLSGDRAAAAQLVVARLLTSAQFLYRSEVGRAADGSEQYALDGFEKATLLAYTLTGSMPDELLLADAEAGALDEAALRGHVRRLWGSAKTRARLGDFFRQWLKVTRLDEMERRPADYPKLTAPSLGASLKAELDGFVGAVVFDGAGTLPALFTETFTIGDANTAPLYGLTAAAPNTRLQLDPKQRRGVLTLASTMAAIASATDPHRDRPVVRGLMVKEQLLCEEVGPPSGINTVAAMNTAMQTPSFDQLTTREQYEAMMQQGAECRACHRQFMPLGFALTQFDALGRHRTTQNGRPVNTAVSDVPFAGTTRGFSGAVELADALAHSPATASCFSKNFVAFATGTAHTEHAETLAASLLKAGPLAFERLIEDALASPHLYARRGVPFVPAPKVAASLLLASGRQLGPDGAATSADGVFRLLYQLDGNLVLYRASGGAIWSSGTAGSTAGRTVMQGDGNLVVYDAAGQARFHTMSHGNPGAQLFIDTNGVLSVVAADGRELFTSRGTP